MKDSMITINFEEVICKVQPDFLRMAFELWSRRYFISVTTSWPDLGEVAKWMVINGLEFNEIYYKV